MRNYKLEKLQNNESFITSERGHSMYPILKSGQNHTLSPIQLHDVKVRDIVYCKIKGIFYTHFVRAIGQKGCLIGNNKGKINGWTKQVYGKVTEIL